MAEIGFVPGVGQQIVLIFTLRWQLFRNSLRTLGGRLEAAALAVIVLFWGFLALGPGAVFAFGAFCRCGAPEAGASTGAPVGSVSLLAAHPFVWLDRPLDRRV